MKVNENIMTIAYEEAYDELHRYYMNLYVLYEKGNFNTLQCVAFPLENLKIF